MVNNIQESSQDIWSKLSSDAQKTCIFLGPLTATSLSPTMLANMMKIPEKDLDSIFADLKQFGILQEITFVQELEEKVATLPAPETNWYLRQGAKLTDDQSEYLRAKANLEQYNKDPQQHKAWKQPRVRLESTFKKYVVNLFLSLRKT